ncbi:UNVERIFIED_CONTAM: hypothetical protein RMT77_007752 [Armadillidium vulgare]
MDNITMEKWIKINSQSSGKDKIARLIQYSSRFLWYYIEIRKDSRDTVTKLQNLEKSLSSFRKLLRFGKSVEVLHGTLNTIHLNDRFLKVVITLSRIYQGIFLLFDHFVWLADIGLVRIERKKYVEYSNKFWLGSIILGLLRDAYEINSAFESNVSLYKKKGSLTHLSNQSKKHFKWSDFIRLLRDHDDVFWDTVKNVADIWIPLTSLGHVNLSSGAIGVLGIISSVAGLMPIINPQLKLLPS